MFKKIMKIGLALLLVPVALVVLAVLVLFVAAFIF